jgi:hypothetical protein
MGIARDDIEYYNEQDPNVGARTIARSEARMTNDNEMTDEVIALRSYDVAIGFRNLDERSALISDFSRTHLTGMANLLAGSIRGRDVIPDARILKKIAADVLKISPWAFEGVLKELAEVDLIRNIRSISGEIVYFTEHIPLVHDDAHERLGENWRNKNPSELERQLVVAMDNLAHSPELEERLYSRLAADRRARQVLRTVGEQASLAQYHQLRSGGELVISPLHAFEHPDRLVHLVESHSTQLVQDAFERIREQPGLAVALDGSEPIVEEMVRLGLVPAPIVIGADRRQRAFAILPYGLSQEYLTSKKQVLERALALIACVRCGEISGGVTRIRFPDRLLAALVDSSRNYCLRGHSSTNRQYALLIRIGMIETVQVGDLPAARLVPTSDNIEAVQLARTLLGRHGEALPGRGNESHAADLLFTGDQYLAPIETIATTRSNAPRLSLKEVQELWETLAGWSTDGTS